MLPFPTKSRNRERFAGFEVETIATIRSCPLNGQYNAAITSCTMAACGVLWSQVARLSSAYMIATQHTSLKWASSVPGDRLWWAIQASSNGMVSRLLIVLVEFHTPCKKAAHPRWLLPLTSLLVKHWCKCRCALGWGGQVGRHTVDGLPLRSPINCTSWRRPGEVLQSTTNVLTDVTLPTTVPSVNFRQPFHYCSS